MQPYMLLLGEGGQVRCMGLEVACLSHQAYREGHSLQAQRDLAQADVLAMGFVLHRALAGAPALDEPDTAKASLRLPPSGRELNKSHAGDLMQEFARGLMAASLAGELAADSRAREEVFVGAMFQNLGRLLVLFYLPEEASQMRQRMQVEKMSEPLAAIAVLGVDLQTLGSGVARSWGLPDTLLRCMRTPVGEPAQQAVPQAERPRWLARAANDLTDILLNVAPAEAPRALAQLSERHARALGLDTTVSRILAKSLNCIGADGTGGVTAEPCGVCPTCTAIDADRYLDYTEMDAASNRGIEEARELIERASYKPSIGRFKVFMIDEAHQLTKDAFNALLKTLEEPPEYLKFVLATTDPEKMLPTVLSRCLQFNLRPMSPHTVQAHLQRVLQAEGVVHEDAALRVLGRAARGSMRDALSLTDQAIAFSGGQVLEAGVRSMLGAVDRSHGLALAHALAARDGAGVMQRVALLREHGMSASGLLEDMAGLLQNVAVAQAAPEALEGDATERADALALADRR
ncbi:hypothetical protein B566_EDAN019068 [Ephemera danica]|nr:hypothetical protein B566_EDAN019068 [Ephemera danica]